MALMESRRISSLLVALDDEVFGVVTNQPAPRR